MNKRTNIQEKIFEYVIKSIIPVTLAISLLVGGIEESLNRMISIATYMVNPDKIFKYFANSDYMNTENAETINKENHKAESTESVITSGNINSAIPDDIQKLIEDAQKKYADSSNDGKIISADYSKQNATSEYNGIYIRNTTLNHHINIEEYLNKQVYAFITENKPAVLIYHTHTTETYELLDRSFYTNERNIRSDNPKENMVRVGEEICKVLEKNGYKTIHDKSIYDESVNGAYERSRANISRIIKDNPSIQIVLDIHRGAIYQKDNSKIKTVTEINGRKAAQIMLISGCEDGNVTDFPNWQKNLTFALNLQEKLKNDNKTFVQPLMFCSRKYNMDLVPCALSMEIGTDANALSEAVYSAELFADSLTELLEEYKI
ncbi:MAG: stage II sporulation protein P [Clostridia bacterium]|nr:stage II sporulation protein P [Clostridia bacterium]